MRTRSARRRKLILGALGAVGIAAVGGTAWATLVKEPPEAPPEFVGASRIAVPERESGDRWLNVTIRFECNEGGTLTARLGDTEVADIDCEREYADEIGAKAVDPGGDVHDSMLGRGLVKSLNAAEVTAKELFVDSTIPVPFEVHMDFSPRRELPIKFSSPRRHADGKRSWDTPEYRINEYGLSVGGVSTNVHPSQWPDLVPIDDKGKEAYARTKEMYANFLKDPLDEADMKADEDRLRAQGLVDKRGRIYVQLYGPDGVTKVGKFATGGTVSED